MLVTHAVSHDKFGKSQSASGTRSGVRARSPAQAVGPNCIQRPTLGQALARTAALIIICASAMLGAGQAQAVPLPMPPNSLAFTLFADGAQVYRSTETSPGVFGWRFLGPVATLFTDDTRSTPVGIHFNVNTAPLGTLTTCPVPGFACPSWQDDDDGSAVTVGRPTATSASPHPDSITELLLPAVSHVNGGVFSDITFVQRLDTVGGLVSICDTPSAADQDCKSHDTATYAFFSIPETGTLLLVGTGLLGLMSMRRARRGDSEWDCRVV